MDDSKDYIINLRVSKDTYEKIKSKAKKNGDTISSLLRSVINDSAEIISDLSSDLTGKHKKSEFNDIVSYHRGVLAQERLCDNCGTHMLKGETMTVGETDKGTSYYFCHRCK
jgi:hypothetical protein